MKQFSLVFLSLQIFFGSLSAYSPEDWDWDSDDDDEIWEYLLGDWEYELEEECDHNKPEPYYRWEEAPSIRMGSKDDTKKASLEEPNLALMTLEAPPVSMVAGCVSAISGSFVDSHVGLVVPGALPLTVQCTYCSSEKKWHFKHKPELKASLSSGGNHINIGYVDDQGSGFPFRGSSSKKAFSFLIPISVFEKGVTNCGSGEISGKTNLKNNHLHFVRDDKDEKYYKLKTGFHSERLFSYVKGGEKHRKGPPLGKFRLKEDALPNGNKIEYSYSGEKLSKITAWG